MCYIYWIFFYNFYIFFLVLVSPGVILLRTIFKQNGNKLIIMIRMVIMDTYPSKKSIPKKNETTWHGYR